MADGEEIRAQPRGRAAIASALRVDSECPTTGEFPATTSDVQNVVPLCRAGKLFQQ